MAKPNIFCSVGEPSGDLHASNLIKHFRHESAEVSFRGFGGPRMASAGCELDFELTEMAVVGLAEVLPKLREFFRIADIASDIFDSAPPSAVLLVDFPGFNWHIAKRAKQRGIPVFYYLPPQLWAWGAWRIKKVKKYVDHVLCNLPFEAPWFQKRGVDAHFVGHPFFDEVADKELDGTFMQEWANHEGCQVAVLPGSRRREVGKIWPMHLAAIRELSARNPKTRFLIACLKQEHADACKQMLNASDQKLNMHFFVDKTSEIIELADCALMKSGSVSLEMMARGTPSVVVYQLGMLTYCAVRPLINLNSMTLPNLISQKTIMPEFLAVGSRVGSTVESAVAAMDRLIADPEARMQQRSQLEELNQQCGQTGASRRAAELIASKLGIVGPEQARNCAA